jgi:hypothetical protein
MVGLILVKLGVRQMEITKLKSAMKLYSDFEKVAFYSVNALLQFRSLSLVKMPLIYFGADTYLKKDYQLLNFSSDFSRCLLFNF